MSGEQAVQPGLVRRVEGIDGRVATVGVKQA